MGRQKEDPDQMGPAEQPREAGGGIMSLRKRRRRHDHRQARDAELADATAKLQAKLAAKAQRAIRKRQEEMEKNHRRWKREEAARKRNDILTAQCGINWYSRRRDAGIYWTHCRTCGQLLHYTDDPNAKPQVCAGRKS